MRLSLRHCLVAGAIGVALGVLATTIVDHHRGSRFIASRLSAKAGLPFVTNHDLDTLVGSHWDSRDIVIRLQASQAPKGAVLLLGDSILEGFWGENLTLGDRRCAVINAGFAGAGVIQLLRHEQAALDEVQPRFVVLSIGLNDAWPGADAASWAADYDEIVRRIVAVGATPILVTPLPPERGFPKVTKSAETVDGFDREVRRIATAQNAVLADVAADATAARAIERPIRTIDGAHPTGTFYHRLETDWILPALLAAERRRGQPCVTEG